MSARFAQTGQAVDWAHYEALKAAWISEHPDASPAEYERAMREIAGKCGV